MTPRTRKSNQETDFKVYYSKKVPKQLHFPHRRKVVRRPKPERNGSGGRQMKFLPEKMGITRDGTVMDSESEDEEEEQNDLPSQHSGEEDGTIEMASQGGVKHGDTRQDEPTPKRKREMPTPRRNRLAKAAADVGDRVEPSRKLRRQSTMTQLADGRLPDSDAEEPEFRPVKRKSRASLGGQGEKEKDKKQRTLTQMIPGMVLLADEEMEDMDSFQIKEEDDETDGDSVTQRLSQQGLFMPATDGDGVRPDLQDTEEGLDGAESSLDVHQTTPPPAVPSVENESAGDEEEYFPTQFIDAPASRTRRTSRRQSDRTALVQDAENAETPGRRKPRRTRFSLLSTPEKRRVFEIASSQSPAESLLSTQTSPEKVNSFVLQERVSNINRVPDTPSKRKRVTFRATPKQSGPPPTLKRFKSTIPDSEDEEGSDIEENLVATSQPSASNGEHSRQGKPVGDHTQAVLGQIDQACADADGDAAWDSRDSSQELGESAAYSVPHEVSPELGGSWAPVLCDDVPPNFEASYRLAYTNSSDSLPVNDSASIGATLHPGIQPVDSHNSRDELPSSPMVLHAESSDEEELDLTTPRTSRHNALSATSKAVYHPADLDDEPIQVPRSPSAPHETQQSHSSKAEQQLQTEWLSYSQYARPPQSSSVFVHDANSYNPTPRPPQSLAQAPHMHMSSQATTVDEVTPRKNRHYNATSANTTPHRLTKSQPFISPAKPPSLFIPSSFPSPSASRLEDWSSPILHPTQHLYGSSQMIGSIEDFSIPPPPPAEHD
jgi:hypothetical protein